MIDAKTIKFISKDEAVTTLKSVHMSSASSERKEALIIALEKRSERLRLDCAIVVKADYE